MKLPIIYGKIIILQMWVCTCDFSPEGASRIYLYKHEEEKLYIPSGKKKETHHFSPEFKSPKTITMEFLQKQSNAPTKY